MDLKWSFDGSQNLSRLGISTVKVGKRASMLVIESATSMHRGMFQCTATNLAGFTTYTTNLEIHGNLNIFKCHGLFIYFLFCMVNYTSVWQRKKTFFL